MDWYRETRLAEVGCATLCSSTCCFLERVGLNLHEPPSHGICSGRTDCAAPAGSRSASERQPLNCKESPWPAQGLGQENGSRSTSRTGVRLRIALNDSAACGAPRAAELCLEGTFLPDTDRSSRSGAGKRSAIRLWPAYGCWRRGRDRRSGGSAWCRSRGSAFQVG